MQMKLMLVDDHPLFIEGLQYLLKTHGIDVVGVATNGREALEQTRSLKPDIILMDIKMPVSSGLDALQLIKAEMPDIKIVILTTSEEDEDLFQAIKFGASGYLLKNTNAQELMAMLSNLEKGEVALSPGLAAKILQEFRKNNEGNQNKLPKAEVINRENEFLTERQLEVLELVVTGKVYKEVGDILGITERTVKYHMGRIIELLQLENRAQVIAYAAKQGINFAPKNNT